MVGGRQCQSTSQLVHKGQPSCMLVHVGGVSSMAAPTEQYQALDLAQIGRGLYYIGEDSVRPADIGQDFWQVHHLQAADLEGHRRYRRDLEAELPQECNEGLLDQLRCAKKQAEEADPLPRVRRQADGRAEGRRRCTERDPVRARA